MTTGKINLPDDIEIATGSNPRDLVILSPPKCGKGTVLGALTRERNAIVFDLERDGYEFISARKISIYDNHLTDFVTAYNNYINYRDALLENKGKYEYLIIDPITDLDTMSEYGGTLMYMYTNPQGKNFNREIIAGKLTGRIYQYGEPEFKTVHDIGEGYGYKHSREWFLQQIELFAQISPYRIYSGHISDKLLHNAATKEEVTGTEIALTGKLKRIFASKVTTIGKMIVDGTKRYLSFLVENDNIIAGSRAPKLKDKILLSDMVDGELQTYWENIYETK